MGKKRAKGLTYEGTKGTKVHEEEKRVKGFAYKGKKIGYAGLANQIFSFILIVSFISFKFIKNYVWKHLNK